MGHAIGIFLRTRLVAGLLQGTVDEAVFGIHDGRLRVVARLLLDTGRSTVASRRQVAEHLHALFAGHVLAQIVEHLTVVLQQFQRQVARGIVLTDVLIGLQILLYLADATLNLMTVVDMDMTGLLARILIHLNDHAEQVFDAHAALERCRHHRHTEKGAECRQVYLIATTLKLVVHIQCTDHAQVHVHKLCRQIEIALQVRDIDDVDDHIGQFLRQMAAHIQFLGTVARQRVGAWQVGEVELIAEERGMSLRRIDGDAGVVADVAVGSRGEVEQRGLATVGVTDKGDVDATATTQGGTAQLTIRQRFDYLLQAAFQLLLFQLLGLFFRHHFNHRCLVVTQRHLVAHQFVLHRVLQRCVEQHLHGLAANKTHLNDAFAETTVAKDLDDDAAFSCF